MSARENRKYLHDVVFPHLKNMPTQYDSCNIGNPALLDFDVYIFNHSRLNTDDITDEYNCGRKGCLAGWYVMLSDRDKRINVDDRRRIQGYDLYSLANHFDLDLPTARQLFAALSPSATNRGSLIYRKGILNRAMKLRGDFDDKPAKR